MSKESVQRAMGQIAYRKRRPGYNNKHHEKYRKKNRGALRMFDQLRRLMIADGCL